MYMEKGGLPKKEIQAKTIVVQSLQFAVEDILYLIDIKQANRKHTFVPQHLKEQLLRTTAVVNMVYTSLVNAHSTDLPAIGDGMGCTWKL